MNRVVLIIVFCFIQFLNGQVLENYPPLQQYYMGGEKGLNVEMIKITKEKGLKPCPSRQLYKLPILVNPDSSINFVKDFDSITIEKNKCAYDFSKQLMPHLKNWIPARLEDKNVKAIAVVTINPFMLYHSNLNPVTNVVKEPTFSRGINSFRSDVGSIFSSYIKVNELRYLTLRFVIDEQGEYSDIEVDNFFEDKVGHKQSLIDKVKRIKGKWTPATFNGAPMSFRLSMNLLQEFSFDWEKQIQEDKYKKTERDTFNRN